MTLHSETEHTHKKSLPVWLN